MDLIDVIYTGCPFYGNRRIKAELNLTHHIPIGRDHVQISMDGRGRCLDNIFVERLWRTVKQENIYLNSYQNVLETKTGLNEYFLFYNDRRRHQSLHNLTPREVYFQ
ncbi:MAG: Transposase orfab subunit b [Candidatus Magasanikbacteria bacterium GW2011_GWA2_42_32]|uniref:Transposase orfab subunit b n=1 Tax=Candidatus Magasanikbacteria bacterium GW2011_GWA2_42_32 TaxID=1619039 RepID=A0A0G1A1E4_9BACT|nr:MAG: Transposase orfab subunit b [Candidatus Magasanikbacteria bacterium GW2011_GWA2_42_32]HBX15775.1 hypothetical protein [Candidatus Magasanikbacteria bacterium]